MDRPMPAATRTAAGAAPREGSAGASSGGANPGGGDSTTGGAGTAGVSETGVAGSQSLHPQDRRRFLSRPLVCCTARPQRRRSPIRRLSQRRLSSSRRRPGWRRRSWRPRCLPGRCSRRCSRRRRIGRIHPRQLRPRRWRRRSPHRYVRRHCSCDDHRSANRCRVAQSNQPRNRTTARSQCRKLPAKRISKELSRALTYWLLKLAKRRESAARKSRSAGYRARLQKEKKAHEKQHASGSSESR